jgi:hypothetical protein
MDLSQQKEKFSDAYLQAVAAVAGFGLAKPIPDDDSIDWIITARGVAGTMRRPRLEVQLKCSARDIVKETHLHFPLDLKNYNDLRYPDPLVPRILVVVTVPEGLNDWLKQTETELHMRHCGYWVTLQGEPDTTNRTTVTVMLPRTQLFTPETLRQMMQRVNRAEAL